MQIENVHLLVVEDSPRFLNELLEWLREYGYQQNQATPPQADGVWKQVCSRIPDSDCNPVVFAAERRGIYPY